MTLVPFTIDGKQYTFGMHEWLAEKIDTKWIHTLKKDDDFVGVVDGAEGSGKSVFAFQLAAKMDPTFSLEDVCMTAQEFKKRIIEKPRGGAVVYDEAFTGLSSKGALTEINKIMVELMMEMRQKNLKIIIVLPTFFMLEKYVALFRARCLFHVYRKRGKRGYYRYYGKKKKKLLYLLGKKFLSYHEPRSDRNGNFNGVYTVDEQAYREKKAKAFSNKERTTKDQRFLLQRNILWWYMTDELGIMQDDIVDLYGFFDISIDRTNIAKENQFIADKIKEEIREPPPKIFTEKILNHIQTRNRYAREERRKADIEHKALLELQKEKRRQEKLLKEKARIDKALSKEEQKTRHLEDPMQDFLEKT